MNDPEGAYVNDQARFAQNPEWPHPRAVGSPLPTGTGPRTPFPQAQGDPKHFTPVPPPGRALSNPPEAAFSADQPSSSLQRAVNALRLALPFVQRIMPLLEGNVANTVSKVLAQHPHPHTPLPPPVNLVPIENGLAELQAEHRDLRDQVVEQNSSLKRVEDQLDMVREATDRNTLEQQELLEDLKSVGNKVNIVALVGLGLLAISILLNLILYLHIQRVLP
jgi:hypothetical protein